MDELLAGLQCIQQRACAEVRPIIVAFAQLGAEFSSPWPTDALKLGRPKLAEKDGSARPIRARSSFQ